MKLRKKEVAKALGIDPKLIGDVRDTNFRKNQEADRRVLTLLIHEACEQVLEGKISIAQAFERIKLIESQYRTSLKQ